MPHSHPNPPLIYACVANELVPLCIPTAVVADCIAICRASLWVSHLIALPWVGLLGIQDSLELFAVWLSVEHISPVDIRGYFDMRVAELPELHSVIVERRLGPLRTSTDEGA